MEEKKTIPVTPPVTAARRVFPVDGRDRALLVLAWGVGVLCAEVLLWGLSGLGMTLLAAAWYGVLFWYGGAAPLARRENRLLLYAVGLLALTFALFANPWLRLWNTLAIVLLMGIQMGGWPGMEVYSVETSAMLGERFLRVMGGLFGYLGAPVQALGSIRGLSRKKMPYVLGALLVCVPLLMVVFPLLTSADALFAQVTRRAADWFDEHLALWALRLIFGLLVAPFLFGLLYSLRRPEPLKRLTRPVEGLSMEAAGPVTVLAVLDVLYAFFLAVQCAALFGGADYLAQVGISYASYARSGFFQLVAVAAVNLACLLACLALCKGKGRGLRMVQVLGTLLVAASGVLLVSALWRMNLYVGAYGLSFKRVLTYWGMAVLAVLLAAALWKVWHRHFRWFRVLLSVGAAGWLLLNYANVDDLVARYNIGRGLDTGAVLSASDGRLGALPALEELLEAQPEETELRQAVEAYFRLRADEMAGQMDDSACTTSTLLTEAKLFAGEVDWSRVYGAQGRACKFGSPQELLSSEVRLPVTEVMRIDGLQFVKRQPLMCTSFAVVDHLLTLTRTTDGRYMVVGDTYEYGGHNCNILDSIN